MVAEPLGADADTESLVAEVVEIFHDDLQVVVEDVEADLIASGVLDSLALVDLLFALERRKGLEVRMDLIEFDDFRTVTAVAAWLRRELSG